MNSTHYEKPILKKWSEHDPLTWDDFQANANLFSTYYAAINTQIYLEFDTVSQTYSPFAAQASNWSWVKRVSEDNDDELEHEQYHFNITEYYTRLLNEEIEKENPDEATANVLLETYRKRLDEMQDKYDNETDHSLNYDYQRLWEYKVDSMLWVTNSENESVFDPFTGIAAFFSRPYSFKHGIDHSDVTYRKYSLDAYDMWFEAVAFQYGEFGVDSLEHKLDALYADDYHLKKEKGIINGADKYSYTYEDTVYQYMRTLVWWQGKDYLYKVHVAYPMFERTEGYQQIADSYLSSIDFAETDSIWLESYKSEKGEKNNDDGWRDLEEGEGIGPFCYNFNDTTAFLFYKAPFLDSEENLHLIFYPLESDYSKITKALAMIDEDETFHFTMDSARNHVVIPTRFLPTKDFLIQFGYFMESDTTYECGTYFFDEAFWVEKNKHVIL